MHFGEQGQLKFIHDTQTVNLTIKDHLNKHKSKSDQIWIASMLLNSTHLYFNDYLLQCAILNLFNWSKTLQMCKRKV